MMYVWKRRPASDLKRQVGLLALLMVILLGAGWAPANAQAPKSASGIIADPAWNPSEKEKEWLGQDRRWLVSLPAATRFVAPTLPDTTTPGVLALTAEQMSEIKRLVAAAGSASGDTMPVVRPVTHLLRDRWMDRGYLSAVVTVRGDTLLLVPGPVWTVGMLDIGGDDFPGRSHLIGTWLPRVGDRFEREDWRQGIDMVLTGVGEAGYPFPRWVTREVALTPEDNTVTIQAILLPGNLSYIGPVTSDLEEDRAARFLSRSSGLRSGGLFENSELARARQRLVARDLYTSVGDPQVYLTSASDTVGIHFPVVPRRKMNRLQIVLGLSRREDGSGSRLSGEVDLNLPNMAGTGRKLQIGWRDDGQQKSLFGFSYLEPLAFGTPLDMGLALDNEVQQDVYTRFRLDNIWRLPVISLWGVELGVGWDRATYPTGSLEKTSRLRGRGAVLHRRGDRSRSGWEGLFAIETARRKSTPRTDLESDTPSTAQLSESVIQEIFEVDTSGELWLGKTFSLAGRASFRQLTGGEPNVPLSEQFRFGGAATLRGYREDEFHGSLAGWGSLEMRIGRPAGSRLYTFYDLGYFEFWTVDPLAANQEALLRVNGWPRGYGLGLLAVTPAGDISLAIGFPGTVDFDQAKLHVTLLETF
jgi:outer membrane protein insertion porin family